MKHLETLDGLRGFAALSVLAFHLGHWWHVDWLAPNAYLAVDFFFCLSGYVLSLAYNGPKHHALTFASFVQVRLIRLMPLVLIAGLVSASYLILKLSTMQAGNDVPAVFKALILGTFSLPNLSAPATVGGPQLFPLNGPQYTLMLELGVNLVWFAIRRHTTLPVSLSLSAASFLILAKTGVGGDTAATILYGVPRVLASFFAGVALFQATHERARTDGVAPAFTMAGLAAVLIMGTVFFWPQTLGMSAILIWSVVVAPMVVFVGARIRLPGRARMIAVVSGALSYPVYVLHYPIFCWINGLMQVALHHQSPLLEGPVVVAAVVTGSALGGVDV